MHYHQIEIITSNEEIQEILISQLSEEGYDGFEQFDNKLIAIIKEDDFNEVLLKEIIEPFNVSFIKKIIPQQNWNAVWESNFQPVIVENFVGIRAHFHSTIQNVQHEIIITPKMSFGTGHHATTYMMMQLMQTIDFNNKSVFDFGTGTGILAILAEKLKANSVLAVDYDDWCIENALENISNNNCKNISIEKKNTAEVNDVFDIVIANINKNIIQDNFEDLHLTSKKGSTILLSGLLVEDENDIIQLSQQKNWIHQKTINKNGWIAMQFLKDNLSE